MGSALVCVELGLEFFLINLAEWVKKSARRRPKATLSRSHSRAVTQDGRPSGGSRSCRRASATPRQARCRFLPLPRCRPLPFPCRLPNLPDLPDLLPDLPDLLWSPRRRTAGRWCWALAGSRRMRARPTSLGGDDQRTEAAWPSGEGTLTAVAPLARSSREGALGREAQHTLSAREAVTVCKGGCNRM